MNIAIVGAGLMGRLTAIALHQQGYNISLFDKDTKQAHQSAAYATAGLLTPLGESLHCERNIVEMGFASLKKWPALLKQLRGYTFFQQTGALVVSHEADIGDYRRFDLHLKKHYANYQTQALNQQQLRELEPELGRSFHHGLYLPDEGQIGNRKLLIALQQEIEQLGISWHCQSAVDAITQVNAGCKILVNGQQQCFDLVIDCRGTGARQAFNGDANTHTSKAPQLRAVRGELFQIFAPAVNISRPVRLMHPRYQLYIAPKGKGFYVVGATEIESDDNGPMTVRSALELLSAAYSVHPGFAEAQIRQQVSQCRPAFSDNQPKIIADKNLLQINGLYRHGFLIAPVILEHALHVVNAIANNNLGNALKNHSLSHPALISIQSENNEHIH